MPLIDTIQSHEPFDLKIIESFEEFTGDSISDASVSLEDTSTLLDSYVDAIETDLDKERIKAILQSFYNEAQTLDAV
jgi:hypothetical protein